MVSWTFYTHFPKVMEMYVSQRKPSNGLKSFQKSSTRQSNGFQQVFKNLASDNPMIGAGFQRKGKTVRTSMHADSFWCSRSCQPEVVYLYGPSYDLRRCTERFTLTSLKCWKCLLLGANLQMISKRFQKASKCHSNEFRKVFKKLTSADQMSFKKF